MDEVTTQSEELQNQKVDLTQGTTVNPIDQNTKVVNMEKSRKQQGDQPLGFAKGLQEQYKT